MKYQLADVFGVSNEIVETYLYRDNIDKLFLDSLSSKKHIIVYGSSKQGKTSLYKRHMPENEYLIVECSPTTDTIDIYRSILRQVGVSSSISTNITSEANSSVDSGFKIKLKIPAITEIEANLGANEGDKSIKTESYSTYEYNISLAQDVSEALLSLKFDKKLIIENFHYLSEETQKKFAFDLRTFHDIGIQFIILGIWKEKNRILQFNGDLVDNTPVTF